MTTITNHSVNGNGKTWYCHATTRQPVTLGDHIIRIMDLPLGIDTFYHHGIVSDLGERGGGGHVDDVKVIHWQYGSRGELPFRIRETTLRKFLGGIKTYHIYVYKTHTLRSTQETLNLARHYLQSGTLSGQYNVIMKNCESFCFQCKLKVPLNRGMPSSSQANTMATWSVLGIGLGISLWLAPKKVDRVARLLFDHIQKRSPTEQQLLYEGAVDVLSPLTVSILDTVHTVYLYYEER